MSRPPALSRTGTPIVRRRRPVQAPTVPASLGDVAQLAVVTCFYNPTNSPLLVENYHRFRQSLSVQPFTLELSFTGEFELDSQVQIVGDPKTQMLWQKERLLNIAETRLSPEFDAIAWIDADILFQRDDWHEQVLETLSAHHVCQLWSTASERQPDGSELTMKSSVCSAWVDNRADWKRLDIWHPGLAWAMRRDTWQQIGGLLESNVIGNGDTHMLRGFLNADLWSDSHLNQNWLDDCNLWRAEAASAIHNRVGVVPGHVEHLWHGPRTGRRYLERLKYLSAYDYDPVTDLYVAGNGLLTWSKRARSNKPEMIESVRNYFHEREQEPANA